MIEKLEEELYEVRGETATDTQRLKSEKEQLSELKERLARLRGDLSTIEGKFAASEGMTEDQLQLKNQLLEAQQELTEEMERLLSSIPTPTDNQIGGIPVDSEYIIFLIDTSGSMHSHCWPLVLKKLTAILDIYPEVKGIQVMNDMGTYMFSGYKGRWIPDTPSRRKAILKNLRTWQVFSNSSPVEGLTTAIRTFYDPNKKISIYVLGDEFSGVAMQPVIDTIDRINREDETGTRRVRIHALGFPVMFQDDLLILNRSTGVRFATLMRALCERNGGAFVGLNSVTP